MKFTVEVEWTNTYINDEKVQPTPCVCEIDLETIGYPFQKHLNDKHIGEDLICIFKDDFNHSPLFDIYVLKCLIKKKSIHVKKKIKFSG